MEEDDFWVPLGLMKCFIESHAQRLPGATKLEWSVPKLTSRVRNVKTENVQSATSTPIVADFHFPWLWLIRITLSVALMFGI